MVYIKTKNTIYVLNFNNRLVKLAFLYSFVFSLLIELFFSVKNFKTRRGTYSKNRLVDLFFVSLTAHIT